MKENCTVNSTRGTSSVGVATVDEQSARQRLGQHRIITAYIVVYIQGLYSTQCTTMLEYEVLSPCWVWPHTRGIGSLRQDMYRTSCIPSDVAVGWYWDFVYIRDLFYVSGGALITGIF
jgi:hypothetical protein